MGPCIELPLTHNSSWSASGDLNGDGFIDIVASSSKSNAFTIFPALPPASTPWIQPIAAQTVLEDQPTGEITVRIGQEGVDPATLQLGVTADTALVKRMDFTGSGGTRTMKITPVPDAYGSTTIAPQLSHGSQMASTSFTFEVTPVNDAPVAPELASPLRTRRHSALMYRSALCFPARKMRSTPQSSSRSVPRRSIPRLFPPAFLPTYGSSTATLRITPAAGHTVLRSSPSPCETAAALPTAAATPPHASPPCRCSTPTISGNAAPLATTGKIPPSVPITPHPPAALPISCAMPSISQRRAGCRHTRGRHRHGLWAASCHLQLPPPFG